MPHLHNVPRRPVGWVVGQEQQDVEGCLCQAQLTAQRLAYRAVGQGDLLGELHIGVHMCHLLYFNFVLFKFELKIAQRRLSVKWGR